MFSPVVIEHWLTDAVAHPGGAVVTVVDSSLADNRSVSVLVVKDGPSILRLTPARADELGVAEGELVRASDLRARLARAGIRLNDPDHLFFLPVAAQEELRAEESEPRARLLTSADAEAFARFEAAAPEDDLDEAFVELDHWLVAGAFDGDDLVAAASMYPWAGTRLADLGVLTLPAFRGQGRARATVKFLSAEALARGYEPQYRCQLENEASVLLARRAGFVELGRWEVALGDDD